jgi:hypothetical protein
MSALVALVVVALILGAGVWVFGSFVGRVVAWVLIVTALWQLGDDHLLMGLLCLAGGVSLWIAAHWLYALRPHVFRGPLAQRVFMTRALSRWDPTRGWGVPVVDTGP